jgi:hypothetical protein
MRIVVCECSKTFDLDELCERRGGEYYAHPSWRAWFCPDCGRSYKAPTTIANAPRIVGRRDIVVDFCALPGTWDDDGEQLTVSPELELTALWRLGQALG